MSHSNSAPCPNDSLVKRRQPVERALVWSLIAVLFVLAFVETWSRYSYQRAYDFLGRRLEVADESGAEALDAADVKDFLNGRRPSRTQDFVGAHEMVANGATHLEVYSWFTFNPIHRREMFVYYDAYGPALKDHPQVLSIQAVEEELFPLLSRNEQHSMDRMRKEEATEPNVRMVSGMPGRSGMRAVPGMGPPGGRGWRLLGTEPADSHGNQPADEKGQGSQPATDTSQE